ncbi:Rha family transcriptional regulator [Bacteroides stercoris]|jgi:Rha family phage regulatory protein|uniref:Rha family transcriptional regulator n=1 Tax=Bacteroides stercoris TaxID=46506 RepID=UPI0022E722C9|nr:Rha family transcriptional regulator [Bacteroides stercoris]
MNDIVFRGKNNQALTNSLLVAEKFGKGHGDVLKAIDALLPKMTENQCKGYFAETSVDIPQPNGGVRNSRVVVMTRDGLTLLVMGFTGKKALKFKLEYIAAFNAMEKAIKEGEYAKVAELEQRVNAIERLAATNTLPEPLAPMSLRDTIRMMVNDCARKTNRPQSDIWRNVYDTLYYRYHVSVRSYKKKHPKETTLEAAERHGKLPYIYAIVSNMNAMLR